MPLIFIIILKLIIICNFLLPGSAHAEANGTTLTTNEPLVKPLETFDASQKAVSQRVIKFANWLDSFFGENRIYQESTENYLKVNFLHLIEDGKSPRYDAQLKGKITLPGTEDRLKLLIESEPEDGVDEVGQDTPLKALESQQQSLGLRYTVEPTDEWSVNTDAGVRFRSKPETFARLRIRRLFPLDDWNIRAAETLFWYRSTGPGSSTRIDLERTLGSKHFFRASTNATWMEENRYFDLIQEFSLFHNLDSRRVISYQTAVQGKTQPNSHVTNYLLSVRFRQQIHHDWLFLELNPQVNFPKENNFNGVKSISLKIEILFGSY